MIRSLFLLLVMMIQAAISFGQQNRDEPTPDTRVKYQEFDFVFHDYETHNSMQEEDEPWMTALNKIITNDTVVLQEYNSYLASEDTVKLQIIPQNDDDRFKVYYTLKHAVTQQYDYRKDGKFEDWSKNRVSWTGYNPKIKLTWTDGYYYLPPVDYQKEERWIKRHLSLRDTLVDVPSEGGNLATFVYKERPALHGAEEGLIKIERYTNGKLVETKYVRILMSYGC